mmetsp:Transcript_27135/g.57944  ORF Transcript_27135/g.57944 Transcript_27135/m.57944 type:complete len:533 (-) Transcript_27135:84-1682(-)|eukprot:CAMPEP_0171346354 /NCGR_PEP_ID=MMETSP0878-20121228/24528_1 /TAXON_ID=67004 /ORGANISM="Thalassiosira weissflogii, Strain CCMP1336" /LENGTH=532 /DNA_ID=CAMNT_0011850017 /DNA_START=57 /DNA_END=1655 /DNA_ORIENTATION=+
MASPSEPVHATVPPMMSPPNNPSASSEFRLTSRLRPEDAIDYITVADPVIHADGINKYTSYRVDCRPPPYDAAAAAAASATAAHAPPQIDTFLQNNSHSYSSVLRRYSDFLWLYERLHKERAGAIVPPLPEKQAVARFSPEFVEERRKHLELFLRRVVLNEELNDAECLMVFLRGEDGEFQRAKALADKMDGSAHSVDLSGSGLGNVTMGGAGAFNLTPKNTNSLKKWFSEAKTSMSGALVQSPDDDLFDEIERYIEALHVQMKRVSNQSTALVKKGREIANALFEFGLAFHQLGQSEGEALGSKLELVGATADKVSAMAAKFSELERLHLEEPFKDYLKIIHAVKLALGRRHDKRVSYTALLTEIETRQVNLNRMRMTPGSEAKAYSMEMSLNRYQQAADLAREDYAEVSQRVLREVDRFKREKAEEMRMVVLEFILLEIEVNRTMERVWGELVTKLEGGKGSSVSGTIAGASSNANVSGNNIRANNPMPTTAPPSMPMQPTYANVPPPPSDSLMESSIQYRDNNLTGMGL